MPRVLFTPHLARFVSSDPVEVPPGSLQSALEAALSGRGQLRGYVLDDQNRLRRHIMVLIDGKPIADPTGLTDEVGPGSEVYVMQALSGG